MFQVADELADELLDLKTQHATLTEEVLVLREQRREKEEDADRCSLYKCVLSIISVFSLYLRSWSVFSL